MSPEEDTSPFDRDVVSRPREQASVSERIAKNPLLVPGAILLGALIIGISLIIGLSAGGSKGADTAGPAIPAADVNIKDVKTAGEPYIGKEDAPVTLAYWSDYQCPYCKATEVGGVPQINSQIPAAIPDLIKKYVDTGKLKIVFKDYAF